MMSSPLPRPLVSTPEHGVNPKLVQLVDQDHEVVADELGQRFVDLGRLGLAAERVAEFPLDQEG